MYGEEDKIIEDSREYSRVAAYLPFDVNILPKNSEAVYRSRISCEFSLVNFPIPPAPEDANLSQWLIMINAKLDSILNLLSIDREGFFPVTYNHLEISGSGMSFLSEKRYNDGDVLEIKIMPYTNSYMVIYLYGEVVKSYEKDDIFRVAVKFICMDEEVRDEILKFVFKRQREILKAKRG